MVLTFFNTIRTENKTSKIIKGIVIAIFSHSLCPYNERKRLQLWFHNITLSPAIRKQSYNGID